MYNVSNMCIEILFGTLSIYECINIYITPKVKI